jgi:hydrogenase maturation factor
MGLDPLGLIASGALLAVVSLDDTPAALDTLGSEGLDAAEIAELLDDQMISIETGSGQVEPLPAFDVDEIARFFTSLER